ncbi:MAG: C39 family peptidase [Acidobacteriota bacterium]|nr:C39 family peptidase [Acidobacteriota bacterium]
MARGAGSAAVALAALLVCAPAAAGSSHAGNLAATHAGDPGGSTRLLDVPYLPQTEDLCGGAAAAMVLRYWGERQVYPEDFAGLVDRSASGIRTDVLVAEVTRRGWRSFPVAAGTDAAGPWIRGHIDQGRPIVALIEVSPNRYHYIVIVAWTGSQVIVHDPARAPFRVMPQAEFDREWAAAGRWALLLLPSEDGATAPTASATLTTTDVRRATGTCGPLIQNLVELSRTDVTAAGTGLVAATELCPEDPAAWRELAGVRFLQSRWAEASDLAEHAARLDPADTEGWNLLATSRFLNDQPDAALGAWNRIGRPPIDLVQVKGLDRTRQPVVIGLIDLHPRELLTTARLGRAARRLHELPSAALTRLSYQPLAGGLAQLEAVVVERPVVPRGVVPIAATAVKAWLHRELQIDVASPTGSGELLTVAWRWWESRPRVALALAVPAVSWLPGVTTIEGSWERPSYATPEISRIERRRGGVTVADWATTSIRWRAGVALDRWAHDSHVSANGAVDVRLADDRVSIGADAAAWAPLGSTLRLAGNDESPPRSGQAARFGRAGLSSAWRSTRQFDRASWTIVAGLEAASVAAPFDLWPGAGTGHARVPLLRAHPLLNEGVVSGPVLGRRLAHATIEYRHPLRTLLGAALSLAAFADTATARHRLRDDNRAPIHVDVGTGVRLALPGAAGTLRADLARGLRDERVVFSAGWAAPWPGRPD